MSLSSYLFERHQIISHRMKERLTTLRAMYRRVERELSAPAMGDQLEPRLMLSAVSLSSAGSIALTDVRQIVSADFNNDGKMDVAATQLHDGKVVVMLGHGDGTFGSQASYLANSNGICYLAAGDFNHDGKIDLVAAVSNNVSVLIGNGDGTFASAIALDVGTTAKGLAVGDFNGDGVDDFAIADGDSNQIHVVISSKTSSPWTAASTQNIDVGSGQTAIAAGDFNKDGVSDLGVINGNANALVVLKGSKSGIQSTNKITIALGDSAYVTSVSFADLNGDGYQDLVYGDSSGGKMNVLLNNKKGGFKTAISSSAATDLESLSIADMNDDGKLDIVASRSTVDGKTIDVLLGNGDGTLTLDNTYDGGGRVWFATTADLNRDGLPDVFSGDSSNNKLAILLNTGSHDVSSSHSYTYVDADGDTVTVALSGPGSAAVHGGGIAGAGADASGIALEGTTSASTLKVTVTKAKNSTTDGTTSIGGLSLGTGTLGKLDAGKLNIANGGAIYGSSAATASIGTIILNNIGSSVTVTLKGTVAGSMILSAGTLGDGCTLDFGTNAIKSLSFSQGGHSGFTAGSVETFTVAHDWMTTTNLSGNANAKLNTLGTATIGGAIKEGGGFNITGSAGTLNLGSISNGATFHVSGSVAVLSVAGNIGQVGMSAKSIGKWTVGGDIAEGSITLDGSADAKFVALGSLTVGGSFAATSEFLLTITDGGSVGAISASSVKNFSIYGSKSTIEKILVTGKKVKGGTNIEADATSYNVNAISIGTVSISGKLTGSNFNLGSDTSTGSLILKSFTVGGLTSNSMINVGKGNLGTLGFSSTDGLQIICSDGNVDKIAIAGNQTGGTVVATVIGTWTVGGDLSSLSYQNPKSTVDSATELKSLAVKGDVTSFSISGSNANVAAISVGGDWTGSAITVLNTLGACTVGGNLDGLALTLTGADAKVPVVLNKMSVAGSASNFSISGVAGGAGALSFGSINKGSISFSNGAISSLTVAGDAVFGADSDNLNPLSAKSFGTINIGTGKTGGDLKNVVLSIVGDSTDTDKTVVLKSLKVRGDMNDVKCSTGVGKGIINSITAGSVSSASYIGFAGMTIKNFTLAKDAKLGDIGTLSGSSQILAGVLNQVSIAGDVTQSAIISGIGGSYSDTIATLGKLTITGVVTSGSIGSNTGSVGTVTLGSMASGSLMTHGSLTKLAVAGNMGSAGVSNSVTYSIGGKLGTWTVGGDLQCVNGTVGYQGNYLSSSDVGKRNVIFNSLTVGGLINEFTLSANGSIGDVSAKRLTSSNIAAGYDLAGLSYVGLETIGSIKVSGDKNFATSSALSNKIYGWKIGTVIVTYPGDNSLATAISTVQIDTLKVTRLNGKANVTKTYSKLDSGDQATFNETGLSLTLLPAFSSIN